MAERHQVGADLLISGEMTQAAIAKELGASKAAVSKWKTKLETQDRRALDAQPASGRPAKLTSQHQRHLLRVLKRGARTDGFETER